MWELPMAVGSGSGVRGAGELCEPGAAHRTPGLPREGFRQAGCSGLGDTDFGPRSKTIGKRQLASCRLRNAHH